MSDTDNGTLKEILREVKALRAEQERQSAWMRSMQGAFEALKEMVHQDYDSTTGGFGSLLKTLEQAVQRDKMMTAGLAALTRAVEDSAKIGHTLTVTCFEDLRELHVALGPAIDQALTAQTAIPPLLRDVDTQVAGLRALIEILRPDLLAED